MKWKSAFASVLILAFSGSIFGQTIEGPKETEVGEMIVLKIAGEQGEDPKVECFPKTPKFVASRSLDGKDILIMFSPGKKEAGKEYTFVFVSNKDKKTLMVSHAVKVVGDIPTPPKPPTPDNKAKYLDELRAAYMVNPDKANLITLIEVLEEVKASSFMSFQDGHAVLKAVSAKKMQPGSIQGVRNEISSILVKDVGMGGDGVAWDEAKFDKVTGDIILALKEVAK